MFPEEKSFEQYLDEYYNWIMRDIIDDFAMQISLQKKLLQNDFGLTTDEVRGYEQQ